MELTATLWPNLLGIQGENLSMEWNNLKEQKCPKCGAFLEKNFKYFCRFCNFSISLGKMHDLGGKSLEEQTKELLRTYPQKKRKTN